MLKDEWQKGTDQQGCPQYKTTDIPIEATENGDNLINLLPITLSDRLVKCIADRGSYTQLGQVEEPQNVLKRPCQPHKVCPQMLQEDLPGEKGDKERQQVEQQVHLGIQHRLMGARRFAHC